MFLRLRNKILLEIVGFWKYIMPSISEKMFNINKSDVYLQFGQIKNFWPFKDTNESVDSKIILLSQKKQVIIDQKWNFILF